MSDHCRHSYVSGPDDPCPECERDALREENDRLRAALREIANRRDYQLPSSQNIARAALGEKA